MFTSDLCCGLPAVEYEWTPKEPISVNSDFVRDVLSYLESMFAALQLLPVITLASYTGRKG